VDYIYNGYKPIGVNLGDRNDGIGRRIGDKLGRRKGRDVWVNSRCREVLIAVDDTSGWQSGKKVVRSQKVELFEKPIALFWANKRPNQ
jgi:hypothetical protein